MKLNHEIVRIKNSEITKCGHLDIRLVDNRYKTVLFTPELETPQPCSRFVDEDYLRLITGTMGIAIGHFGKKKYGKEAAEKSLDKGLEDFRKVVKNIDNFKDLRSFLNRNRLLIELFPDDRNFFVDMFLRLSTDIKKPLSLDMIEKVNALRNSKKINCYLKE